MPETRDKYHHIPVRKASEFVKESFRTIDISKDEGIKAVIGKLKSDPDGSMKVQKYLFDVEKWELEEAKEWVEAHKSADRIITSKANVGITCQKSIISDPVDIDEKEYRITHVISTEDVDREGDRMIARDFEATIKEYKTNPVVFWAHNNDPAVPKLPIGQNAKLYKPDKRTIAETIFAAKEYPFAHLVYNLHAGKYLRGWSVGFDPREAEYVDEKWTHGSVVQNLYDWELIEYSSAPIPMNAGALTLMYKTLAKFTDGAVTVPEYPAKVTGFEFEKVGLPNALKSIVRLVEKEGRVLSGKNRNLIKNAVEALQSLLEATDPNASPEKATSEIARLKEEQNKLFRIIGIYQQVMEGLLKMKQ